MIEGLQANSERTNYYGTSVKNNSTLYVHEEVLRKSVELRQLMLDSGLTKHTITISTEDA